jgi:hypothetical protein
MSNHSEIRGASETCMTCILILKWREKPDSDTGWMTGIRAWKKGESLESVWQALALGVVECRGSREICHAKVSTETIDIRVPAWIRHALAAVGMQMHLEDKTSSPL